MSKALELLEEAVRLLKEESNQQTEMVADNQGKVELSTLVAGETFKLGEHDFVVLKQEQGETHVISKHFMATSKQFDEDTKDYNKSSLKRFIETEIQPVIEAEVGAENLIEHEVDLISVDMQQEFEPCRCKVRPITFDEAREHNNLLVNKELSDWWWTCTPWSTEERGWKYSIAVVSPSGSINCNYFYYDYSGVRPFCILKSNIFVSRGE